MQHFSLLYENFESFENFIKLNNIENETSVLVQIFTSQNDTDYISMLQNVINKSLPNASIIGATTNAEIDSQGLHHHSTVISISCFKTTAIKTTLIENLDQNSYLLGSQIIQCFDKSDLDQSKLAISFCDGLHTNGEEYLHGISDTAKNLTISGGMAADYSKFSKTYVFSNDKISENGAVMALLINPDLSVYTDFSFDWEAIGTTHIVTKSIENRVYTIDNINSVEFYEKYLGKKVALSLPSIGIEFPLMILQDNMLCARAAVAKHEDGSLSFAGNVKEGSIVKFGFGNVNKIVKKGYETAVSIGNLAIEGIYVYSCMAR